ncbi:MAG TPA: YfhO family protein [Drouetiella sp.]
MNERRAVALVAIVYCAIAVGLLSPLLFGGKTTFLADITYNNEPAAKFVSEFWQHHGKFPLWNPWILNGVPQIAVTWPMVYFPTSIGIGQPYGVGTGLFMLLHLLLAGVGGFLWQYSSHRFQPPNFMAAAFFGLSFMLCGYMFGCPINLLLMASAAWIPITLYMLDLICAAPKWWQCGILALTLGMQYSAGRPEIAVTSSVLYVVYFICNMGALRLRALAMVAVAFILAAGFAAFGYIPLLELAMNSPPALKFSLLKSSYWSAGFADWLTLLMTQPFGSINMLSDTDYVTYAGSLPYITSLFVGTPVLTLSTLALARNWKHSVPAISLILLAVLFALGQFGPFGGAIDNQNIVRYPIKLALFAIFGLLVMAANGWRYVFDGSVSRKVIARVLIFWLMIIAGAAVVNGNLHSLTEPEHVLAKGIILAALGGVVASLLMILKNRSTEIILLVLVGFSFAVNDKALLHPVAPNSYFDKGSTIANVIKQHCQLEPQNYRVLSLIDNTLPVPKTLDKVPENMIEEEFSSYCREILRPNTTIDAHLQSSNGISVIPTWNSLFIDVGLLPRSSLSKVKHPLGNSDLPLYRYCQATSTAYVQTAKSMQTADGTMAPLPLLDKQYFELLKEDDDLNYRLYTIIHIRPRVSIIRNLKFVQTREEALKYVNRSDTNNFDPLQEVLLVGTKPSLGAGTPPKISSNYAEVELDQNEFMKASANVTVPSALVLTDGYYPGWEAYDNGKQTPILIADGVMRAILLEPGEHKIVFRYRPLSWFYGLLLFFASLTTAGFMILSRFVKTNPSW